MTQPNNPALKERINEIAKRIVGDADFYSLADAEVCESLIIQAVTEFAALQRETRGEQLDLGKIVDAFFAKATEGDLIALLDTPEMKELAKVKYPILRDAEEYSSELSQLRAANGELEVKDRVKTDEINVMTRENRDLPQQLADAKGRLEEAEKNAARYQWIRSEGLQHIKWEGLTTDTCDVGLDYAIDARLAQPNP